MRLYDDLAGWYHLLTPPSDYVWEAERYAALARAHARDGEVRTLLDLGSGGGNVSWHLRQWFACTLVDRSPAMLAASQTINPDCEHVEGDLRSLRLGRTFDVVLLQDAVMYMTSEDDLRAAVATAFAHLRPGGCALIAPDMTRETFREGETYGGVDSADGGRGLRFVEWVRDPDPTDTTITVDFAMLLREGDDVRAVHERHLHGLFERAVYGRAIADAGFTLIDRLEHAGVLIGVRA